MPVQGHFAVVPQPFKQPQVHSAFSISIFRKCLKICLLDLASPHSHQCAGWPADVIDCFVDVAVGLSLGCCASEPGNAGVIGTLEIELN